jgi:hypothetical protein
MNVFDYLRKPYPVSQNRWAITLGISLFISVFMILFQPFGLHNLESGEKSWMLAGYGGVTLLVLLIDIFILPLVFPLFFKEENWTVFREFLLLVWIVITIAMGNYLYSVGLTIVNWAGMKGFFIFTGFTLSVAIIPIIVVIVISYNALLKKNLEASRQLNRFIAEKDGDGDLPVTWLVITSENRKQQVRIPASSLICVESEGNYIHTWYLKEGKIVGLLIRNTIKNIGIQVGKAENLFKCHRAYIINLRFIEKILGNSQGYRLRVKYLDKEIPVARNYSKSFREAMSKAT